MKNFRLKLSLIFFILIFPGFIMAQIKVTGVVTDAEDGSTLPGVTILEKNSGIGSITNIDGEYSIAVPSDAILVFSYVGYASQEITVGSQSVINIQLNKQIELLDEVIVIGYGVQKKADKTGAVAQVKAEDLSGGVITDAIQTLQGKTAGVLVSKKGGDPNEGYFIRIRGASGFDSRTQPLYVIDGVPGVDPTTVAPEDIETFNILKDAASAAIYGSRGSNGVIIITTKKGKQNDFQVQLNTKVSMDQVANKVDLLSASDIRNYAQGILEEAQIENPQYTIDSVFNDGGANTDWQDEIYRTGITQSYNLNFSGGKDNNSYYASVTQSDWEGIMKGTEKERTIAKVNIVQKGIDDRLTLSGTMSATFEKNDYENYDGWDQDDIIYQALTRNPTDPVYDENDDYYNIERIFNYRNPLQIIDEIDNNREAKRYFGNLKADFEFFKGFVGSANVGYTRDDQETYYFRPAGIYDSGYGKREYKNETKKLIELTGNYVKSINEAHNMDVMVGYSWEEFMDDGFFAQARGPQSEHIGANDLETFSDFAYGDIDSWKGMWRLIGFFGRVQYNYNSKYYLSGSLRRDGSTRFGDDGKWGWFPTVAVGWNLHEEGFIQNVDWINQLKIRLSYGVSGNQDIDKYNSLMIFQSTGIMTDPETGEDIITFLPQWNENPKLKWEESNEYNLGIDFALYESRINGSLEFYYKRTKDLLGKYPAESTTDLAKYTWDNAGEYENRGIELFVQAFAINSSKFKWKTNLNLSHNKSKVIDLGKYFDDDDVRKMGQISGRGMVGEEYYVTGILEGEEIGAFYLPVYVTIDENTGKFIYKSNSGGYTDELGKAQREVVGSPNPDLEIGWSNSITVFKNWNIDINFRSWIGHDLYNATESFFDNPDLPNINASPSALDWEEKGRVTSATVADLYVEDASFLKLDYLSLGYTFNTSNLEWLNKLNVYVASNNLFTITGYSGVDPETKIDGVSYGIDQYNVYPKTRTFTFGINATF
ncbi:SusC/RagA family TonB-linked outer membrane protein [Bacteroidota bacterium]